MEQCNIENVELLEQSAQLAQDGYAGALEAFGLSYWKSGVYLAVGHSGQTRGWILTISVVAPQFERLLKEVLPILKAGTVPFKIAADKGVVKSLLNGQMGLLFLGKVISIFPPDAASGGKLAESLIAITSNYRGPRVLTDAHLGGCLFARYGAHSPQLVFGANGEAEYYFHDNDGELRKDRFDIPFVLPSGVQWPFAGPAPVRPISKKGMPSNLHSLQTLKLDARGDVTKSLWLQKWWRIRTCVVKEGRLNMFVDDFSRGIAERLKWQYELHNDLSDVIPIPKVYGLLEDHGDMFLVMEYIEGKSLDAVINDLYDNRAWCDLDDATRRRLVDLMLQFLRIVGGMHEQGYIHRDINPANFLVKKDNSLFLIDLELAYCYRTRKPAPPFRYGTPWFMSKEQQNVAEPTIEQDVYAVGATLLIFLTGLLPNKFATTEPDIFRAQLEYFVDDPAIVQILADCLSNDPCQRPTIEGIINEIERMTDRPWAKGKRDSMPECSATFVQKTIELGIKALATEMFTNNQGMWVSRSFDEGDLSYYQSENLAVQPGFYTGVSGIGFFLARAHQAGYSIRPCIAMYRQSVEMLNSDFLPQNEHLPGGLFNGAAGVALGLGEGYAAGLLAAKSEILSNVEAWLQNLNMDGLGLMKGVAGKLLALAQIQMAVKNRISSHSVEALVGQIISRQQGDGSWLALSDNKKDWLKMTGLAHGTAGIVLSLLAMLAEFPDDSIVGPLQRGLSFLEKSAWRKKGSYIWPIHQKSKEIDMGLVSGQIGIILTFIKAHQVLGVAKYRTIAETCLESLPARVIARNISLAQGLAGLGETYLEAAAVFNAEKWLHRANWVRDCILHEFQQGPDDSRYWYADHAPFSTADLFVGNCGILHFLLRCQHVGQFSHPICIIKSKMLNNY